MTKKTKKKKTAKKKTEKKSAKKQVKKKPDEKKAITIGETKVNCSYSHIIDIERAVPNPMNPNTHPEKQVVKLAALIKYHGWRHPIVISERSGFIVSGHCRLLAAQLLELKQVPADFQDFESEAQEFSVLVADNAVAEFAEIDGLKMAEIINYIDHTNYPLELTALDEAQILDYIDGPTGDPGRTDDDAVPPLNDTEPITKVGNLWLLGEHRLLCGDSTKAEDVERLMNGQKADMVFTDPPYNVDYGVSKNPRHKIRKIENDKQSPVQWQEFCQRAFEIIKNNNKGDVYIWGASGPDGMKMRLWLTEAGCHWSATIIWKKQQLVLSPANYQRMYEPCFYGWFNKSSFVADRKQTEVWEFDRPHDSKLHPTMKPVDICVYGIGNSCKKGNIVLDLFLGSGSTLIACEKIKRKCYGMEIDPRYCDVIVQRWEDYTGGKAELAEKVG